MININDAWQLQSSSKIAQGGATLSTAAADTDGWYDITLPATVLGALVDSGQFDDPFFGTNLQKIPGQGPPATNFANHEMPEDSPFAVAWWYRKEIHVPEDAGPHLSLQFDGINYRANIWLNGKCIADKNTVVGPYRDYELDISDHIDRDGVNVLAIEVFAPKPCDLAINWVDWNPSPLDKNMGLWRDVWLRHSGPVSLRAPHVVSKLHKEQRAELTVAGDLCNHSKKPQRVEVRTSLLGHCLKKTIELQAGQTLRYELKPADYPELCIDNPQLWWPRFMGEPILHELKTEIWLDDSCSDQDQHQFGIREISSKLNENEHAQFFVNGRPVQIRGAGWATDLFLRRQPERDWAQLEYVKALNLNTIRFEGMLERQEFLERCDRDGIMVIAGWCCCDCWEKWDEWTGESHIVAEGSLRSQIRRVRQHACMIDWWYGSDFPPPEHVEQSYLNILNEEHWPNARHSSAANKPTELTGPSGMKMEGPYDYVPPNYWLEDELRGGAFGFATEICPGPAVPPIESLRKMLPEENYWPIDEVWNFHAGGQEFHNIEHATRALNENYGPATGIEDYAQWSQLLSYETQRAMFEAYARNKGKATGVIQWMLNNSWPSLIWHLYDYYLRPGGGFFGTQKACEPLHVMFAYDDHSVVVINHMSQAFSKLKLRVRMFNLEMEELFAAITAVDLEADGKVKALDLPVLSDISQPYFVDLRLSDETGKMVSHNFYCLPAKPDVLDHDKNFWIHTPVKEYADLTALRELPQTTLELKANREQAGPDEVLRVKLSNPTKHLAYFVQLRATDAQGDDVLPIVWSDNYIALLPHESCTVTASHPGAAGFPSDLHVEISGINVARTAIKAETDIKPSNLPTIDKTAVCF